LDGCVVDEDVQASVLLHRKRNGVLAVFFDGCVTTDKVNSFSKSCRCIFVDVNADDFGFGCGECFTD
jgi:hypothetical protein